MKGEEIIKKIGGMPDGETRPFMGEEGCRIYLDACHRCNKCVFCVGDTRAAKENNINVLNWEVNSILRRRFDN